MDTIANMNKLPQLYQFVGIDAVTMQNAILLQLGAEFVGKKNSWRKTLISNQLLLSKKEK